ncbi:pyridoxal phosphate-dependent aminotransferase [Hippea maritima]|uniref:Aminotransferase n=1 Tax=Hippea maritima (strain ATCC 700847 / DSM 10411 / MH2) TaxID=760142 RepID=F2LY30_HIPMA|nr:aminotransferase class I/II-fold pyridoxal phosphate-dependent enzyme [Hippea maritima]AEA34353.1 Aspartate transaminase [Hippea maritima DSM 10411]
MSCVNMNVVDLPLSATLEINEKSNLMIAQGKKVYKLGLGQSPFPVPVPVVESLKKYAYIKDYLPVKGLYELREAVRKYYLKSQGIEIETDNILIGPGSKELMFIAQLVMYSELLLPSPSWVSYAPQAKILGRKVSWLNTTKANDWLLKAGTLEEYCKNNPNTSKVMILNYPNNPTGKTYNEGQLKEIAEVARRFGVIIISDEIYGELHHEGKHISIAKFYPEGTIISSGLSKWCGAGGWRLGTFAIPKELSWLADKMASVASETFTSVSAPIQYASIRAFEFDDEIVDYLNRSRRILKGLALYIYDSFNKVGIDTPLADGAFYYLPDFSKLKDKLNRKGIYTSRQLCSTVLDETSVAFLPGDDFGRPSDEFTARIAYVDFDGEVALEAAKKEEVDEKFLRKYCANTIEAIDRVCDWVSGL